MIVIPRSSRRLRTLLRHIIIRKRHRKRQDLLSYKRRMLKPSHSTFLASFPVPWNLGAHMQAHLCKEFKQEPNSRRCIHCGDPATMHSLIPAAFPTREKSGAGFETAVLGHASMLLLLARQALTKYQCVAWGSSLVVKAMAWRGQISQNGDEGPAERIALYALRKLHIRNESRSGRTNEAVLRLIILVDHAWFSLYYFARTKSGPKA